MNSRNTMRIAAASLLMACASHAFAPPRSAAAVPATMPAVISVDAFPASASGIAPELAAKFKAKLITLTVNNMPALQAMSELAKVSGYTIKPGYDNIFSNGNRKPANVTLAVVDQPFWSVFRDICIRGNLTLWANGGQEDNSIRIAPGNYTGPAGMRGPASIQGVFFAVPNSIERENSVNMAAPATVNRNIHIQMQMSFEPSAVISSMAWEPVIDEATDDNGNSMVKPSPSSNVNRMNNMQQPRGTTSWQQITLPYPTTNPGHHIVKIKGHIPAKIAGSVEKIEISDPLNAAPTTRTIGAKEITVATLKKNTGHYELEVSITRGNEEVQSFFQNGNITPRAHLTNASGDEASSYYSGGSTNQDKRTINFGFNNFKGDAAKLVVEVPTEVQDADIPFELDNLPLP